MSESKIIKRYGRRGQRAAAAAGRKASVPLHVMLEPAEFETYKKLADELGMTMRDFVRMAIEAIVRERNMVKLGHQNAYDEMQARRDRLVKGISDVDANDEPDDASDDLRDISTSLTKPGVELSILEQLMGSDRDPVRRALLSQAERISRLEGVVGAYAQKLERIEHRIDGFGVPKYSRE